MGNGVELINDFDQDTTRKFLSIGCSGSSFTSTGTFVGAGTVSGTLQSDCIDADRFRRALKQSVVKNGNVDSVDAADAIDTITGYDGPKQQRVALLIQRTKGSGGAEFLADASDSTIDDVLSFEVDVDNPAYEGLQERVRVGIVRQYSRNKLDTDNWGGDLYPNAEDGTEVAAGIANDIDALDDSEKIKDLSDLLAREGGGPYMSGDPPDRLFKGAALEVRTARHLLEEGELNSNDRLRLSYKPENFESRLDNFNDDDLEAIAKRVYSSNDDSNVDKVEEILNLNDDSAQDVRPEFDALERSGNDGSSIIYYESKNFKDYSRATDDIAQSTEQNLVRLFTDRLVDANSNLGRDELDNVDVNLAVKSENGKETLISEINRNWLDEDQIIVPDKGS